MDVELPDGTVVEGVPEGTTKAQLQAKLANSNVSWNPRQESGSFIQRHMERVRSSRAAWDKAIPPGTGWGEGFSKGVHRAGEAVTDFLSQPTSDGKPSPIPPEAAAAAGGITNFIGNALPASVTSARFADIPPVSMGNKPANALMQMAIKPEKADRLSGAAGKATQTMLDEGINATRGGMEKAGALVDKLHKGVESQIAASTTAVPIAPIAEKYLAQYEKALSQANSAEDVAAVQKVWSDFIKNPAIAGSDSMTSQMAHLLKRGTQQAVGAKAYGEAGTTATEAQKGIARYLREGVGEANPQVLEPLKREAALMNVRDVAMNRVLAKGNNNLLSLGALRIGDNPLSSAAFMADKSALVQSLAARLIHQGTRPDVANAMAQAITASSNQPRQ